MADASEWMGQGSPRVDSDDLDPTSATVAESAEAVRARVSACYHEHGGELARFVLGVVRNPDQAGDVMQATLSRALEMGHATRPETLKGWLFRVAFHEAMALRRRSRMGDNAHRRLAALGHSRGSTATPPEISLIRVETAQAVRHALENLPDEQRKVVVARVYGDKTFAQIARDAGLPLGTVLTRMRLALEKLRHALQPNANEGDD